MEQLHEPDQARHLSNTASSVDGGMQHGSPSLAQAAQALAQDGMVRLALFALGLAATPLFLPILSGNLFTLYWQYAIYFPFLGFCLIAIRLRQERVSDAGERRFWSLLYLAFLWWGFSLIADPAADVLFFDRRIAHDLLSHLPYFVVYGAFIVALEVHPHGSDDPVVYPLRLINWLGTTLLLLGLLSYVLVIPVIVDGTPGALFTSSLALFVALDGYLLMRLWYLCSVAGSFAWRQVYALLFLGVFAWGVGDLVLLLEGEGILIDPGWGTIWDLLWLFVYVAVILATRAPVATGENSPRLHAARPTGIGPMVLYSLLPLLLHLLAYRAGVPFEEYRADREVLVIALTLLLATLTFAYHQLMQRENLRLATAEEATRRRLAHQAFHDDLTGLPNRNLFRDRLQLTMAESTRQGTRCAVLFCDLDHFKAINDSLGHAAGDHTLVAVGQRLLNSVRARDTVSRFGGDEFAIVLQGISRTTDVSYFAEKLLGALAEPMEVEDKVHALTASIGIAIFPDDGADEDSLLKQADTAMYQAKLHGRNRFRMFTPAMNDAAIARQAIERGLRGAYAESRFVLHYQAMVDLQTGQPIAFETLLRWNDPNKGWVRPANFLDVADQTGLIVPIGRWLLGSACRWAASLPAGESAPAITVNLTARQLRDPCLLDDVKAALFFSGLTPSRLILEIKEDTAWTLFADPNALRQVRELGVRIAIDDFGSGLGTLKHLQLAAVDMVKLDKTLIGELADGTVESTILEAIVSMAHALNFYVVAEGIESSPVLSLIENSGCDAAQGYLVDRPDTGEKAKRKLSKFRESDWHRSVEALKALPTSETESLVEA